MVCTVCVQLMVFTLILLCGDGFMDFIHHPKSKILKIKNLNHDVSEAGSASVLRWMEGEKESP
jgi:hypothetical protein